MRSLIIILLAMAGISTIQAQGIEFFHGSWDEAIEEAKKQEKIIFVDAYAVWCGPCKRMSKNVFPDEKVGEFYNKHFINMKLDMERGEGLKFRKKYPVSAFPTLFYIDYSGELVQKVVGAQQVDGLISLGNQALGKIDRSKDYAAEYEKGNRDPELVYNYVKALNQTGKPSLKIANDYLKTQKDLASPQNLRFILEAATVADSRIFDLLIKHWRKIAAQESEETIKEKVLSACRATAKKAIEFESEELLDEAKAKMKKYYPEKATNFAAQAEMDFCLAIGDAAHYVEACKNYAKKVAKNDPDKLHELAKKLVQHFAKDENAGKQAELFAKQAAQMSDNYVFYLTYASILKKHGKQDQAVKAANTSLELARTIGAKAVKTVERFIKRMEG